MCTGTAASRLVHVPMSLAEVPTGRLEEAVIITRIAAEKEWDGPLGGWSEA